MPVNFLGNNFKNPNAASQQSPVFDSFEDEKQRLAEGYDDVVDELSAKWKIEYASAQIFPEAVANIHPEVRNFLLEFSRVSDYDEISKQAGLDEKGRDALGQIVWKIAQTKKFGEIANEVNSQVALASSASLISQLLEQKIIGKIVLLSAKPITQSRQGEIVAKKELKLSLSQALLQYPKLGEQSITSNPLKLRYFPTPVRSSIKNWITDYHDCLGAGKHETMDRGNYLFHSENGKKLTPVERQKVSLMLKSLDEETLLDIDSDEQKIVFTVAPEAPVKGSQSVAEMPARQTNQFAPVARREELSSRQAISFGQPSVQGARTSEEISQVEKVQTPPQVRSDFSNDFNNKSKQSEDVAQARIRQSLNFSNLQSQQGVKKAEAAKVFDFEDSDYASRLREKISANSTHESDFGTFSINKSNERTEVEPQKQSFGSLSFSSAQELPVEKTATDVSQKLEPSTPNPTMKSSGGAKTWNSPDFKRQISPAVQLKENQTDSIQRSVSEEQGSMAAQKSYSPYVIVPSHYQEKSSPSADEKKDPKIQGNMVDLS
ncbi:MAG: hypothetical protein WCF93_00745 [Candidatus Moraniibacteriota bacterium]